MVIKIQIIGTITQGETSTLENKLMKSSIFLMHKKMKWQMPQTRIVWHFLRLISLRNEISHQVVSNQENRMISKITNLQKHKKSARKNQPRQSYKYMKTMILMRLKMSSYKNQLSYLNSRRKRKSPKIKK